MKSINTIEVLLAGTPVGELVASRQGIYFAYHPQWVAQGFNLSPPEHGLHSPTPESC